MNAHLKYIKDIENNLAFTASATTVQGSVRKALFYSPLAMVSNATSGNLY